MENPATFIPLEGITIGERRKNLFLQLNKLPKDAIVIQSLNPQTALEEKFKLDALIHFGAVPQLIEMLKCENPAFIRRILNISACMEAISNYSDRELLCLLSEVSFTTKEKILNRLPSFLQNDQERNTKTYDAIFNTYGFYLSSKLLPICNSEIVVGSIKENRWIPTARQLKIVIRRHPDVVEEIFKLLLAMEKSKGQYKKLLTVLTKSDPDVVTKLYEADISHRMGRRTTRHFVKQNQGAVTREPSRYYKFLHHKEIAKAIGASFPDMLLGLFPRNVERFAGSLPEILKVVNCRAPNSLLETFRKKYGKEVWECEELLTREVLQLLTVEQRAGVSRPEGMTEDEWMCYSPIDQSVPYLKQRVSLTSDIDARAQLMELLVETCKVNNSKDTLAQLCRHVAKYHRNDHMTVRLGFLRRIRTSYGLKNLDDTHWGPIYELMQLFFLNNETFIYLHEFLEPYIRFRLRMSLPVKDQLTLWVKAQTYHFNICQDTPAFERQCLLEIGEIIPSVAVSDEFNVTNCYNLFLHTLVSWNKRHPRDPISLYSYKDALEHVTTTLIGTKDSTYSIDGITKHCIQSLENLEERNKLLALYLAPSHKFLQLNVLKWLCCKEPKVLVDSIADIATNLLSMYQLTRSQSFWQLFRGYSHLQLPEKLADLCMQSINSTADCVMQNAITGLSYLLPPQRYANLVDSQIPKTDGEKTEKKIFKHLGKCIKNSPPELVILNCLPLFCKANARVIQNSLQSIVGNLNEPKLLPLFAELVECTTAIRKQVVQLTLRNVDKPHAFKYLSNFVYAGNSHGYDRFFLKTCFRFFVQNPDDDSWRLIEGLIWRVKLKDRAASKLLLGKKIPSAYFSEYFTTVWDILHDDVKNIEGLLDMITRDNIGLLPREFCDDIVTKLLWKNDEENLQASVHSFACHYLIYCDADIDLVFPILREYVAQALKDSDINSRGRASVRNFVTQFCLHFLTDSSTNVKALDTFLEQWKKSFKPGETFDESLHLELTRIYVGKLPLVEIAARFGQLCNALVKSDGLMVVAPFCEKLVSVLNHFVKNTEFLEEDVCTIIETMYKTTQTIACKALIILLMTQYPATLKDTLEKYNAILRNLEACDDAVIQSFLHNHFTAISTQ